MSQAIAIKDEIKSSPDILSETSKKMTFEEYLLAESEKQRAEKLAAKLIELGVDMESI